MPIIRYSMGDVAMWTNFESGHFQVLGRSTVGVTVGQSRFDLRDLRAVIARAMTGETVHGVQILLRRSKGKDELVSRIAARPQEQNVVPQKYERKWTELTSVPEQSSRTLILWSWTLYP